MNTAQALASFFLLFFIVAMLVPTLRVWRSSGVNPLVLPHSDDTEGFVGMMFKALVVLLGGYLAARAAGWAMPVGPIALPFADVAEVLGWAFLASSLVWVVLAQAQMGQSWRVGIDPAVRTEFVCRGLFQISRNPIFLGMMVQLAGLFLIHPDAITLAVLAAAYLLISVQIRQEELYLTRMHGEPYARYRAKVRRWL